MSSSVLITGAGMGLGLEMALYLGAKGFTVYATIPESNQRDAVEAQAVRRNPLGGHVRTRVDDRLH